MSTLYTYWRSSAAYRVRIALNLKGVAYDSMPVHLVKNEQTSDEYLKHNPQGLVPAWVEGDNTFTQSLAIIEYLEETHPAPPLLPQDPVTKAHARATSYAIVCETHPVLNLRVLKYLTNEMGLNEAQKMQWYHHWMNENLAATEKMIRTHGLHKNFCCGDTPTLADICLVPMLYNARRFECDLSACPTLVEIEHNCAQIEAFQQALPENQPDAT